MASDTQQLQLDNKSCTQIGKRLLCECYGGVLIMPCKSMNIIIYQCELLESSVKLFEFNTSYINKT